MYALILFIAMAAVDDYRMGYIEFFGQKGIDVAAVRSSLPMKDGDLYTEEAKRLITKAVLKTTGSKPTDVNFGCCDENHNLSIYIGLPGSSSHGFTYLPKPVGNAHLSPELVKVSERLGQAIEKAVEKGGDAPREDDSQGYALMKDPAARAAQLLLRQYALKHESELLRVLELSSDAEQRGIACEALGYARQSPRQIAALVRAARDSGGTVRNNATRALGVLLRSNGKLANQIPPDTFIEMIGSGIWTDRNKGAMVLEQLTFGRDPVLLTRLRKESLDALIEMAGWRDSSHAYFSRMILGRIAGLPETQLSELAWTGPVKTIIDKVLSCRAP